MPDISTEIAELIAALQALQSLVAKGKGKPVNHLHDITEKIQQLAFRADPVRQPPCIFDPSDPQMVGRITACMLLLQSRLSLGSFKNDKFYGSGIYAIYYNGGFKPYGPLSGTETPIYVGKADPGTPGAPTAMLQGVKLAVRLNEHANSIAKSENLDLSDFECRYLVVKSGMQKAAEEHLIQYFKPIWNSEIRVCFGIGKHGDSADTRGNKRSPWDVIHPGRAWAAASTEDQKPRETILREIAEHLKKHPPLKAIDYRDLLVGR